MGIEERLMNFGLTRQEAVIYLLLFREGQLNGYEASKLTSISRSNAYNALASLVEKGAAYIIEGDTVKYTPVPVEEFCNNKIAEMKNNKEKILESVPKRRCESNGYITITGEKHIMDKFRNILINVKSRIYLSVYEDILKRFEDELLDLIKRGIKVVIITDSKFKLEGAIIYHAQNKPGQIRLIADSKYVLTGEISDKVNSTCLYSSNNNLVEIFKESLTNEIKLIKLRKDDY
ncbi:Sugar-specific transcriptional regulator TrmB [Clostridium sp. DSM 8431]|uniref:TrmB family transcriptional regulator n=1 Tax=Clostridium sp. DSM 8431 TaxID=1761781 RepID=UPI0008F02B4E|nr:TrmB family transcriptional regulator [Clostridium sp. DSM 8431]SFU56720.1 Sugar-specific transcriptional regulator TrmB [Clostridium sp. DSM 8431]